MSALGQMQSGRRRSMPGMPSSPAQPAQASAIEQRPDDGEQDAIAAEDLGLKAEGQRSVDYSATRLVSFRLPVDVHDRFRALMREVEERYPRLRKASLTELVIALLEEGPQTGDEVAELIRRKRIAENEEG